jgi:hypothetical protein
MIPVLKRESTLTFEQFNNDYSKLLDNYIIRESGMTHDSKYRHEIKQITKVTKTGFRIKDNDNNIYDFDGYVKGRNSRMGIGYHDRCYLITEDEVKEISEIWKNNKIRNILFKEIKENMDKVSDINVLNSILELINKNSKEKK